jgi:thiamine biosynthesis protein ThiS
MTVVVNGKEQEVPDGTTVRQLVERLGLGGSPCAAEVNKDLVPRREHESRRLKPGDHVEIVTLVGGG